MLVYDVQIDRLTNGWSVEIDATIIHVACCCQTRGAFVLSLESTLFFCNAITIFQYCDREKTVDMV